MQTAKGIKHGEETIGEFCGFKLNIKKDFFPYTYLVIQGAVSHYMEMGDDPLGNITRIKHVLDGIGADKQVFIDRLDTEETRLANAQREIKRPFPKELELKQKMERLIELNVMLEEGRDRKAKERHI